MRICLLTHTFPRFLGDTAAPFMGELAEALAKTDNEIIILTPFDEKFNFAVKRPYKIITYKYIWPTSLHLLGYSRTLQGDRKLRLPTYFLSPLMFIFGFIALLRLVWREKVDVISAHWIIPNGFIAALVSKITKTPYTVTIPGSDIYLGGKNWLFRELVGFAASNARVVISDSAHYLEALNNLGFDPKNTAVIRYGVNTSKFKTIKKDQSILKKFNFKVNSPMLLAVGRLVAKKGFIYLIKALPKILSQIPEAMLVIVGDGDQKRELISLITKLDLEKQVIFAGTVPHDQLIKYYNLADVFIMPSIRDESGNIDASPVAMMEAIACGSLVVATSFAGNDGLIKEGETGYLVEEKNSNQIAQRVIDLLGKKNNNKLRSEIRRIAEENFSTAKVAQKYLEIFG